MSFEGPLKVFVKRERRWREGYGRVAGEHVEVHESVLGGELLARASVVEEAARRGLPAELGIACPPGEENCQFSLGPSLLASAPSFQACQDWLSALKLRNPQIQMARTQTVRSASPPPQPTASLPDSVAAAVALLLSSSSSSSCSASDCARLARPVQSLCMADLKKIKSSLQMHESHETAASRALEAAVAELAGLLKEFVGAVRLFSETEAPAERTRLRELARDLGEAHARVLQKEEALKRAAASNGGGASPRANSAPLRSVKQQQHPPPTPPPPQPKQKSALDEAVDELVEAAVRGPKEAVAATKQVQALAMAQLRAGKTASDSSPAERARLEPCVAAAASTLKELVAAVRVLARDGLDEHLQETQRLARALQEGCANLANLLSSSSSSSSSSGGGGGSNSGNNNASPSPVPLGNKSPRGPSLSMEQLIALADTGSSRSSSEDVTTSTTTMRASPAPLQKQSPVAADVKEPEEELEDEGLYEEERLRDDTHRLLARQLREAVHELCVWSRAGAEGGDEEANRRVRGPLCSALASILAYKFKVGSISWLGSWGGPQHFWQFIMDFSTNSSVNTVAGLSLQKCLKQLAGDPKAGHDDNSRFRSFVVVALNQNKLSRWLAEITDAGHAGQAAKFYEPGAFLAEKDSRAVLLELLRPLEKLKWCMEVHYEFILRERKKQQQHQQQ